VSCSSSYGQTNPLTNILKRNSNFTLFGENASYTKKLFCELSGMSNNKGVRRWRCILLRVRFRALHTLLWVRRWRHKKWNGDKRHSANNELVRVTQA